MTELAATPPAADPESLHRRLGLTDEELDSIRARLGRDPNPIELAMFGVMWSERCSRKSSKPLLATLPTRGPGMVAGPGENSGVVGVGEGLAVAFRLEGHIGSSAAEPDRDAANVVGDVLRSIYALGARPLGLLVALRFGDPAEAQTRHLVDAVVGGVAGYSHGAGVPIVGGELMFDPSYGGSPLVNVMAIGVLEERRLISAEIPSPGDLVVLFGSTTGHEGLGEASDRAGAAPAARAASGRPRTCPAVLVGDPFAGKLSMEASLEQIERGLVGAIAGLGAGGITRASAELADRAGAGILLDLDAIPGRERRVAAFEVLRAESGERMLATCRPRSYPAVREVCERRDLPVAVVGRLTGDGDIAVVERGVDPDGRPSPGATEIARIPVRALTSDAIVHHRLAVAPARRRAAPAPGAPAQAQDGLPERGMDPAAVLVALLGSANLSSRRWVVDRYHASGQGNGVDWPGRGTAVLHVEGTSMALVASVDAYQVVGAIDPYLGAQLSVAEAARKVSITGARPLGISACLTYGNPELPGSFWQLEQGVRGMGDACRALGLAVTVEDVSLDNEPPGGVIAPTPEIGAVGLLDDIALLVGPAFREIGDAVILVGQSKPGMAGSAYASLAGISSEDALPGIDLEREAALQSFIREAVARGLVASAQDVFGGGLAVALAECAMWGGLGANLRLAVSGSPAMELFGESPSRLVLSCRQRHAAAVELLARQFGLAVEMLGTVGGGRLRIELTGLGATGAAEERGSRVADALDVALEDLRRTWDHGLAQALGVEPMRGHAAEALGSRPSDGQDE